MRCTGGAAARGFGARGRGGLRRVFGLRRCFGFTSDFAGAAANRAFLDDRDHLLAGDRGAGFELDFLQHAVDGRGHFEHDLVGLQVDRFSSRDTASPAFLCQVAMVASETDSGRTGTLTSMAMASVLGKEV
jgi:hypothetical protein